jgi:hypothetical protein
LGHSLKKTGEMGLGFVNVKGTHTLSLAKLVYSSATEMSRSSCAAGWRAVTGAPVWRIVQTT